MKFVTQTEILVTQANLSQYVTPELELFVFLIFSSGAFQFYTSMLISNGAISFSSGHFPSESIFFSI